MYQTGPIIWRFRGFLGVPVEIGQTLVLLVGLFGLLGLTGGADPLFLALFLTMLVLIIYLHELGHAWACLVQGVPVRRIVLHGGGGFCEQAKGATRHQQEFIVAMGPLVNLGLWALASLVAEYVWRQGIGPISFGYYLMLFATLNIYLFFFNLLPVQPLDGGRLLQLLLMRAMAPREAMKIAGGVGLVFAVLWWPALFYLWYSTGWILLFFPSIALHYRMMKGEYRH
ncbi:site-2 protease family protein [Rhodobacteraceae bacterium 10Alg 79]|uniref:Site-2 protease family protein n=2 Tax=Rhodalgimonas zhirmunskyi TaxID=2964767 RepID=A0AAJ1U8K9_9RHOB|nr:site-2 protease family protein [Rhodoalgimonas zhirmunskyi]